MKHITCNLKLITFLMILFYVVSCMFYVLPVRAVSPTSEPSPTGEETLGDKVKEIREAVKEKVREKIELTNQQKAKGYVGEISKLTEISFTLDSKKGSLNVQVASQAAILNKNNKKVTAKELKNGDFCIVMGYLLDNNVFDAKRIVIINQPQKTVREVAFGKVTDISAEEKILTVKNEKKGLTYMVVINDKTTITKKMDKNVEKVSFSEIEIGDQLVAIGAVTENEEKIITAKIIHVIPGLSKPLTTPKPTVTLKPTASLNPTASPTL